MSCVSSQTDAQALNLALCEGSLLVNLMGSQAWIHVEVLRTVNLT